jgi:hypothetical protein
MCALLTERAALLARVEALEKAVREWVSECAACDGTGVLSAGTVCQEDCADCRDIRELLR